MSEAMQAPKLRRIGWMVDPDSKVDKALVARTIQGLRSLMDDEGCVVEPIQIVNRRYVPSLFRRWFPWGSQATDKNLDLVGRALSGYKGRLQVLPPRIFNDQSVSDDTLSYHLSCYAQLTHTDVLIAMEGMRKKLFQPLRLSFVSVLSLQSRVPVLVVGPKSRFVRSIRTILFPVVDPDKSQSGFENLLEFAKVASAKVVVLYRFLNEGESGYWLPMDGRFGVVPFFEPATLQERNSKLKVLSGWAKLGRDQGVDTEIKLDNTSAGFTKCLMNAQRKSSADMIAIDPAYFESFYYEGALMELVHECPCPVWICRPTGQSACAEFLRDIRSRLATA